MIITVITPTADQPKGIALLERYMQAQTIRPDQWIVADDGEVPASLTMGQHHLIRPREYEGGKSLASNMLRALKVADGDLIIVMEHDDFYTPNHIETCMRQIDGYLATGSIWQRYYNVEHKTFKVMRNVGSALCNTAFMRNLIPAMRGSAEQAFEKNAIGVDSLFWKSIPEDRINLHEINTVVGIKGLPGRKGLGMGHKPAAAQWEADPDGIKLREWCGEYAENYEHL